MDPHSRTRAAGFSFRGDDMKLRIIMFIFLAIAETLPLGCAIAPRYVMSIDSISADKAGGKLAYLLLPGNKDVPPQDLQFREFTAYVHRALAARGFKRTDNIENADIAIFMAYGIGNPTQQYYSYSLPTYGQTGVSSATSYCSYGMCSTTFTPSYGVTGYQSHVGSYTTFDRYLVLDAYDLAVYKKEGKLDPVWRTVVTSTGSSGDLRRVFPMLIAGSKAYMGSNTGQRRSVSLFEDSPEALEIKGPAATPPAAEPAMKD